MGDAFRRLDWDKKGLRVDGRYLSNLRFADDIVLISGTKEELIEMLADLKRESGKIGLNMNIDKTKLLTPDLGDVHLEGQKIEKVNEFIYLGHTITLGKENQTAEIIRRIRLTWAAVGRLGTKLRNPTLPVNLKRKVFNTCILPVLTYGMETMTLTDKSANRLRTTQRAIERNMLGVNEEIRKITKVDGVIEYIERQKWRWVGHVARQDNDRWTRRIVQGVQGNIKEVLVVHRNDGSRNKRDSEKKMAPMEWMQ